MAGGILRSLENGPPGARRTRKKVRVTTLQSTRIKLRRRRKKKLAMERVKTWEAKNGFDRRMNRWQGVWPTEKAWDPELRVGGWISSKVALAEGIGLSRVGENYG